MLINHLKIYIAGPYSEKTEIKKIKNVNFTIDAAIKIFLKGHYPYIPHLTHFVDKRSKDTRQKLEWKDYMKWHEPWLRVCDALIYLGRSRGADLELKKARKLGKKIFYSLDEIPFLNK